MRSPTLPPFLLRAFAWLRTILLVAIASLTLTGCMQYDVSVSFHTPQAGEFVQYVKLSDRLTALGNQSAQDWLNSLEARAHQVNGSVKHLSRQELQITVPFSTANDFVRKFNQWFNPEAIATEPIAQSPQRPTASPRSRDRRSQAQARTRDTRPYSDSAPPSSALSPSLISTQLQLKQANYLLAVRHVLDLTVDLRSLGLTNESGQVLVTPGSLVDLSFQVNSPGGVRNLDPTENAATATATPLGQTWRLQPGQLNHIQAAFWVPSPLGWGALMITGLVALGTLIQQRRTAS